MLSNLRLKLLYLKTNAILFGCLIFGLSLSLCEIACAPETKSLPVSKEHREPKSTLADPSLPVLEKRYDEFCALLSEIHAQAQAKAEDQAQTQQFNPSAKDSLKLITHFLKPYSARIAAQALFLSVAKALEGPIYRCLNDKFFSAIQAQAKTSDSTSVNISDLMRNAYALIFYVTAQNLYQKLLAWETKNVSQAVKQDVILTLYKYLLEHKSSFFQSESASSVVSVVPQVAHGMSALMSQSLQSFLNIAITLSSIISYTSKQDTRSAIVTTMWIPVAAWLMYKLFRKQNDLDSQSFGKMAVVNSHLDDSLANINSIQAFTGKDHELAILHKNLQEANKSNSLTDLSRLTVGAISDITMTVYLSVLLALAWTNPKTTPNNISDVFNSGYNVSGCVQWIPFVYQDALQQWNTVLSGFKTILQPHTADKPTATKLVVNQGEIIFDNVKFAYEGRDDFHFESNITIKAGEKVGIVGSSGGGKSTFVGLLSRLYEAKSGTITIDGQNISDVTLDSLRENIAIVPQNTPLFNRSLLDNICYGKFDATEEEVMQAAKKACIHDTIAEMPDGYNTKIGSCGQLSGGQKQRLAIARAILKNAPILVLDEATSALDSVTESLIQENLQKLMEGRTAIIIAHRLATLKNVDRIIVFNNGKIIAQGKHEELLESSEVYQKLWEAQVSGLLQANPVSLSTKTLQ